MGVEGATAFGNKTLDEIGLPVGHELDGLFAADGLLAHEAVDREGLFPGVVGFGAENVFGGGFAKLAAGFLVGPERHEIADVHLVAEIEFSPFVTVVFRVIHDF